jgi:hypothetical protein
MQIAIIHAEIPKDFVRRISAREKYGRSTARPN